MNVTNAAETCNKLDTLIALRGKIAATIDITESGRDIAALSKRLMEVIDEIEELQRQEEVKESPISKRKAKIKNA